MQTVATRLGPLHVSVTGEGPPALLWHSLFVDSTSWDRVLPALGGHRRLILVDGPAHGTNPPAPRPFGLADCVDAAADILDHLDVAEPIDWVGNAWGGHTGVLFAATHPTRTRSVIAIGSPMHALTQAERRTIRLLRLLYRIAGPAPVVGPVVSALIGPGAMPTDHSVVADAFRRATRRGMYDAIGGLSLNRPDLVPTLRGLTTPTILTTNVDDPMWTVPVAAAAAAELSVGTLAVTSGRGHVGPLLQAPVEVADLIIELWADPAAAVDRYRTQIASA